MHAITKDDAVLLFRKLADEQSNVWCVGRLTNWILMLKGKIVVDSDSQVTMRAEGGGFTVQLNVNGMTFSYAEPGKMDIPEYVSLPSEVKDSSIIAISFPLRITPDKPAHTTVVLEQLMFMEVPKGMKF